MAIYDSEFNQNRFQVQLKTLQEYCTNLEGNTCTRFLTETLRNLKVQSHLSGVFFTLTKLSLVQPVINATKRENIQFAEANQKLFAIYDETKTLNHLILSACKNQLDQLDLTKIGSDFINKNDVVNTFLINLTSDLL